MQHAEMMESLRSLLESADHVDVKTVTSSVDMKSFVAGLINWRPAWARVLFRIRNIFAKWCGLEYDFQPSPKLTAETVPTTPGDPVDFFELHAYSPERLYVMFASDKHLDAYLAVVPEPGSEGLVNYSVYTIVMYNNRLGPIYFNVIRPFHHLIVQAMVQAAAKGVEEVPCAAC
ncbi:DUF2867 domain-containing protein [Desulfovibrio inopinatus]|uniref:DUF2867 domain-containing protein n=1 Tax=Desulfovibrio inopinatus TaxID=102109 RepID=UPI000419D224|nr:DUF2867 domain-containing protein [Desulfovibrio inopinatus]